MTRNHVFYYLRAHEMKANRQYVNAKTLGTTAIILIMIAIAWVGICGVAIAGSIFGVFFSTEFYSYYIAN